MTTLIIPRADNERFETLEAFKNLQKIGVRVVFVPLFKVYFNLDIPKDYQQCSAVCATSRNGLRALNQIPIFHRELLFVTGPASFNMALQMPFKYIFQSPDGRVSGLIQIIREQAKHFRKPLLYMRGDVIKTPLKECLSNHHIPVVEHHAYQLDLCPHGESKLKEELSLNPFGVAILSERIAKVLLTIFQSTPLRVNTKFFSLSSDITHVLKKISPNIRQAGTPNLDTLNTLIKEDLGKPL